MIIVFTLNIIFLNLYISIEIFLYLNLMAYLKTMSLFHNIKSAQVIVYITKQSIHNIK